MNRSRVGSRRMNFEAYNMVHQAFGEKLHMHYQHSVRVFLHLILYPFVTQSFVHCLRRNRLYLCSLSFFWGGVGAFLSCASQSHQPISVLVLSLLPGLQSLAPVAFCRHFFCLGLFVGMVRRCWRLIHMNVDEVRFVTSIRV